MRQAADRALALLNDMAPVRDEELVDASESEFARALFERIVATPAERPASTPSPANSPDGVAAADANGRGPYPNRAVGLALATAAAGVVVAAVALIPGDRSGLAPDAATAALHQAAVASAQQPDEALEPGQYYYVRTRGSGAGSQSPLRETWIGYDGGLVARDGKTGETIDQGREIYRLGDRGPELTYEELVALPENRARLSELVRDAVQPSIPGDPRQPTNEQMIVNMREGLYAKPIPLNLRAAFYDVASQVPGIEVYPEVQLPTGQVGTAMGVTRDDEGGLREEVIFDPATGDMIALASVWEGERDFESVILESGVVDDVGKKPRIAQEQR